MLLKTAKNGVLTARSALRTLKRRLRAPDFPTGDHVLVHVGCGDVQIPGAINVDGQWLPHIHHVADVRSLPMLASNTVDEVYACHVLEHVGFNETVPTLREWWRILKPGGTVRISVPDFDHLIAIYQDKGRRVLPIMPALLGGQDADHNFHRVIFNQGHLTSCLEEAGFTDVKPWTAADVSFESNDWASKPYIVEGKEYPLSLNLCATKPPQPA